MFLNNLKDADTDLLHSCITRSRRCKQFECFRKLVDVYETSPENVQDLLELMQQVQE